MNFREWLEVHFTFDPAIDEFRILVREAIAQDLPPDMAARQKSFSGVNSDPADSRVWAAILHKRGWSAPHWPVEYGGTGWSPMQLYAFNDEMASAWAPETCLAVTHMCGPVIYTFGSDAMKQRFLPGFLDGSFFVAQGFSEPGNGSDLARLRTSAERRNDTYLVNGQKIWTSSAHASDWGFFLVRTDPAAKPQAGISMMMIKLDSPGITIRRIAEINGDADLCEVFLDDVEVPVENLIGEENMGWTYAKFLLEHERAASSFIFKNKREFARTRQLAEAGIAGGEPLVRSERFRDRLARIHGELTALEWSVLRELSGEEFRYGAAAAASTLKVAGSRLQQAIAELQTDILGALATRYFPFEVGERPAPDALWPVEVAGRTAHALIARAATIYGGTLQVQKNLIAKLAFNL